MTIKLEKPWPLTQDLRHSERVGTSTASSYPPSGNFDHLIVAVDVATKYVILRPSRGETAEAAVGILLDIIRRFGRPGRVTTDRGRAYMSELFMRACRGLFIRFSPAASEWHGGACQQNTHASGLNHMQRRWKPVVETGGRD